MRNGWRPSVNPVWENDKSGGRDLGVRAVEVVVLDRYLPLDPVDQVRFELRVEYVRDPVVREGALLWGAKAIHGKIGYAGEREYIYPRYSKVVLVAHFGEDAVPERGWP